MLFNNMDRTVHDVQAATMGTLTVEVLLLLLVLPAQVQSRPAPTPSVHLGKCMCPIHVCIESYTACGQESHWGNHLRRVQRGLQSLSVPHAFFDIASC